MKKKNILLFALLFLSFFLIISIILAVDIFSFCQKYNVYPINVLKLHLSFPMFQLVILCVIMVFVVPLSLSVTLFEFIKQIKGSNASNFVRYTYEEYKAYRTKKKEEKQAKEKAKLQEKLDKLQKTE